MIKEFGCHTEFVERDAELKPALKRAFDFVRKESKPAFVEVFVDPDVLQEIWAGLLTAGMGSIPWDELPEEGQRIIEAGGMVNMMYAQIVHPSWQPHLFKF